MGKNDYQKSYTRQIESIILAIYSVFNMSQIIIGYQEDWDLWSQMIALGSMLYSWVYFFGQRLS